MQSSLGFVVFVALLGAGLSASDVKWTKIHAKWSFGSALSHLAKKAFFDIPATKEDATKAGWEEARKEDLVSVWCLPDDPRVCTLYDAQGSIAGMQICFPQADLDKAPYKWREHKLFFADNLLNVASACGRFYIVPQDVLKNGGRSSFDQVGSGLWLQEGDSLKEIPKTADEMVKQSWTRENCIPGMGRHYYYNISETMDCQSMEPYFLLTDPHTGKLQALGFQTFGPKSERHEGEQDWWENVPAMAVKPTLPNAPDCLVDWARDYGVLSLHVYFVDRPYFITCPLF